MGAALALIGVGRAAWALAGEYGRGDPKHPIAASTWPKGLSVVANRIDRARGHWINEIDCFEYEGDAADFNDFLKDYARVPNATVYLDSKASKGASFPNTSVGYDWEMNVMGWSNVASASVTLYTDQRIRLKDLRVPLEVNLSAAGTNNMEVQKFVAAHKAWQAKAKRRIR